MPQFPSTRKVRKPNKRQVTPLVFITEVPYHTDLRIRTPEGEKARELEIKNLVRRDIWEILLEEDVPKGAKMITGSFVVTIEDVETENPIFEARFVAQGNRDSERDQLVQDSTTACQSTVHQLVAMATIIGFDVWTVDTSHDYL